ncbi:hypothetical protein P171DRAFT_368743 [Karstenula rhodostoma CBS 690.94]|uniref:BZIP domain-containing protein n=1 Tax=Karstenula rhodostoma CBS 690.94 TaxID=1392251 RepID=A0A9P4P850_9PLEO|nr:hypothetical protein P171DRAFT_368743 [Karstenula rhodostoma CBS 690.94]
MASLASPSSSSTSTSSTHKRPRVTAEHTLSRVRENQRRHRARRKDYIATLEQKLADTEAQLAATRAEITVLRRERETRQDTHADAGMQSEMRALEHLVDTLPSPPLGDVALTLLPTSVLSLSLSLSLDADEDADPAPPSPECAACHTRPAPAPTESTTLCAQAYVLIAQQNFRGIDAGTIRLWLWQGYRRARRQGEGCRVENGALFRLLDYISGGV